MRKLLALILLGVAAASPSVARADFVYATTSGGQLISFDSSTPGTIQSNVLITGVAGDLVGIDFRPAALGTLYGLANDGGVGRIYTINTTTGGATLVYTLTTVLSGTSFGVDFNPVPDALRITSNTGQNLRITGFPTNAFATITTDGPLSLTGVVGSGYTNSFAGTTTTTLYDIRATDSSLYTQNPPNAGTLNLVGALGTTTNELVGFDIARGNVAFASLNGGNEFGTLNLTTGAFTNTGAVGGGFAGRVTGIAVAPVPAPGGLALFAVGAGLVGIIRRRVRG